MSFPVNAGEAVQWSCRRACDAGRRTTEAFEGAAAQTLAEPAHRRTLAPLTVADTIEKSIDKVVGQAPKPPIDNPELALVFAGVPGSLAQTGGSAAPASPVGSTPHCPTPTQEATGATAAAGRPGTPGRLGCAPSPRGSPTSASIRL